MNIKQLYIGFAACCAAASVFVGCNNAKYDVIENGLYFEEATSSTYVQKKVMDANNNTIVTITPRIARSIAQEFHVGVEIDTALIREYNAKYGSNFEVIPAEYIKFNQVMDTIKVGNVATDPFEMTVKPLPDNGTTYAIPLRLVNIDGPVALMESTSKFIYLLDKPLVQFVPEMTTESHPKTDQVNNLWNETVKAWSLECHVRMSGFQINNQAIFNFNASTEIYIRFGDAPIPYNSLQIKYMGTQNNTTFLFEKDKWYHIAFVYDGSKLSLYVNGNKDFEVATDGGDVTMNGMEMISSNEYFKDKCRMGQIRLWKKALSENEIKSNMYYPVKADDANLLGYWKLDEGEGLIFKDCRVLPDGGVPRDMTAQGPITWIPNTRFDGK